MHVGILLGPSKRGDNEKELKFYLAEIHMILCARVITNFVVIVVVVVTAYYINIYKHASLK
jgi:hypothetical protein